jgi:hypothetical protein
MRIAAPVMLSGVVSIGLLQGGCNTLPAPPKPPSPIASVEEREAYAVQVREYNEILERYAKAIEGGAKLGPLASAFGPWGEAVAALIGLGGAVGAAAIRKKKIQS